MGSQHVDHPSSHASATAGGRNVGHHRRPFIAPVLQPPTTLLDLLPKLLPVKIVLTYQAIKSIDMDGSQVAAPATLLAFAALTPLVLWWQALRTREQPAPMQYVIRTAAFVAWAFFTGDPLAPYASVPRWIVALIAASVSLLGFIVLELGKHSVAPTTRRDRSQARRSNDSAMS